MQVTLPLDARSSGPSVGRLLCLLGVGFGIAVGGGATIGGGILRTPGDVAGYMGSAWLTLVVWLVGGLFTLLCSGSVIELATMLPRSGGWYIFSERAFGKRVGFVVGCCDWMNITVSNAFLSVALGEIASELNPYLSSHVTLVALSSFCALAFVNLAGLQTGSRTQGVTSAAKALIFFVLIIGCFAYSPPAEFRSTVAHSPVHASKLLAGWILAFQAVVVTYDGWYTPMYFAEEDQNPSRNLRRSIIGTVLSCVAIFLLLNVALIHVLGMDRLRLSKVPVADASTAVFGSYGGQIILLTSAVTLISCINANLLTAPRILYAMARDHLLPRTLAAVNQGGTPAWALLSCLGVGVVLILSGTVESLISIASVIAVTTYLSGFAALLVLRKREPLLARPYKTWWYPWSTIGALVASVGFLLGAVIGDLRHSVFTIILVALSYLISGIITRARAVTLTAPGSRDAAALESARD